MSEKKQDRFVKEALVTEDMLASAVGSGSVPVLAPPQVAAQREDRKSGVLWKSVTP